jgi:hypothetical protein
MFNVIPMKNPMLELLVFLSVRWRSLPMPLSMMEGNIVTAYYLGAAIPLTIIPWYNSKTGGSLQPLVINAGGAIVFTEIIRKMISCLNWILDRLKHSRDFGDLTTSWETSGNKNLRWNFISPVGGFYAGNSFGNI